MQKALSKNRARVLHPSRRGPRLRLSPFCSSASRFARSTCFRVDLLAVQRSSSTSSTGQAKDRDWERKPARLAKAGACVLRRSSQGSPRTTRTHSSCHHALDRLSVSRARADALHKPLSSGRLGLDNTSSVHTKPHPRRLVPVPRLRHQHRAATTHTAGFSLRKSPPRTPRSAAPTGP